MVLYNQVKPTKKFLNFLRQTAVTATKKFTTIKSL